MIAGLRRSASQHLACSGACDFDEHDPDRQSTAQRTPNGTATQSGRVAILLSTYNGEAFLPAQLRSLSAQSHRDWRLYWRDDGSGDRSMELVQAFAADLGGERTVRLKGPPVGPAASFLTLLRSAQTGDCDSVAFMDQDDVWLPDKLARGLAALATVPAEIPALYCARQTLVDAGLRPIGESRRLRRPAGFPAALTQNIATGCTIMLNRPAVALISASRPPVVCMHDWWCYLLVAAAGGQILCDTEPVVLYRQHGANVVGAPASRLRRAIAALRRGRTAFMTMFRGNVTALLDHREMLTASAQIQLSQLDEAMRRGPLARLSLLRMPGLVRDTRLENWLFRLWFLLG